MAQHILAIDQGTTGTTVALINQEGQVVAKTNEEYPQIYPQPGWVEHDPEQIWQSLLNALKKCLEQGQVAPTSIAAIGITNQRETVVMWERVSHKPIHNAIVWQCRRTTDFCASLKKRGYEKMIIKKTGLVIDPYFSASKLRWFLDNVGTARIRAQKGELAAGTIDSYLIWRLSAGKAHVTDVSNASRTQLMNIDKCVWDKDLLKLFKVPEACLPTITASSGVLATTLNVPGLPDGIPISGVAGDQQAALFGQTCFQAGQAKCTYGTGSFILMNTGTKRVQSKSRLLTTVAWRLKPEGQVIYALEGGAFVCGAAVQWLRDEMGFIDHSHEIETLAEQVSSTEGVEFVPALTGLGAPYWDPRARGIITGITRGTRRAHIARATLEAMALQNVDILMAMQKDAGRRLQDLRVDGGASANNLLMRLQADFLGQTILRPKMIETTVAGAAYLAGLGVGFWPDLSEIKKVWRIDQEFTPKLSKRERDNRLQSWHQAIAKATLHT